MYLQKIPEDVKTTTPIKIRYDCCGKDNTLKHKDASKNFDKNNGKHICRSCWLKNDNPAKRKEVQEKIKKTNLDRYGSTCALNTKKNIASRNEKMFGTEEAVKKIVEKRRTTNRKKYGSDHPMQNDQVKAKQQAVLTERYGTHVPLRNEEVKAKMQKTVQDRYGVTNVAMLPEVRAKMAKTMRENYGVEYYNQLPEMREYLRENCPQWLKESWDNPWAKGITRPEEWNQKQRETVSQLIVDGKWKSSHKNCWRGYYKSTGKCKRHVSFFRSGFELIYHYYLDHSNEVEWYDYEPFVISYKFENMMYGYVPDFIVKFVGDDVLHIKEVKADYLHDSKKTQAKYNGANKFVSQHNMDYEVLLKNDIYALNIDLEEIIDCSNVEIIHNPRVATKNPE